MTTCMDAAGFHGNPCLQIQGKKKVEEEQCMQWVQWYYSHKDVAQSTMNTEGSKYSIVGIWDVTLNSCKQRYLLWPWPFLLLYQHCGSNSLGVWNQFLNPWPLSVKKQQQEEVDLLGIKLLSSNSLSFNINPGTKLAINPQETPIFCIHSNSQWDVCPAGGLWGGWALAFWEVCWKFMSITTRQKLNFPSRHF